MKLQQQQQLEVVLNLRLRVHADVRPFVSSFLKELWCKGGERLDRWLVGGAFARWQEAPTLMNGTCSSEEGVGDGSLMCWVHCAHAAARFTCHRDLQCLLGEFSFLFFFIMIFFFMCALCHFHLGFCSVRSVSCRYLQPCCNAAPSTDFINIYYFIVEARTRVEIMGRRRKELLRSVFALPASVSSQFMVCWIVMCLAEHTELPHVAHQKIYFFCSVFFLCPLPPQRELIDLPGVFCIKSFLPLFFQLFPDAAVLICCPLNVLSETSGDTCDEH